VRLAVVLGVVFAIFAHVVILLFGRAIIPGGGDDEGRLQQVELLAADDPGKEKDEQEPVPEEKKDEIESETEQPPDASEIIESLEMTPAEMAPALDTASLSAIEAALSGVGGSGDFTQSLDFASGGIIGGKGKGGGLDQALDQAFDLAEIDQKPRVVFQSAPLYPGGMRGKKVEGVVTIVFVVDSSGKVERPRVESSSNPAFDKPALDAVKKWKFEPAVKGGQRVNCKMRAPIRFQPS
jgi:periplasmic protein TonB